MTKFLGKISQFEFLVMTDKNFFAYKLFLSLNISDFNLFLCENCNPPEKSNPPLSQQTPSKSWGPVKPAPFWKFGGSTPPPPAERGEGCPLYVFITLIITNFWEFHFNYYELFNEENLLKILFIKFAKSMNYRYKKRLFTIFLWDWLLDF